MASKSSRKVGKARGLFALGSLAQGFTQGLDREREFSMKVAENLIKQQQKQQDDSEQQANLRLKLMTAMQPQQFPDPSNPSKIITIPGIPQKDIETQFKGVLQAPPAQPVPNLPPINVGAKGRPVAPPTQGLAGSGEAKYKERRSTLLSGLETINQLESKFDQLTAEGKTGLGLGTAKGYVGGKLEQDPTAKDYMAYKEGLTAFIGRNVGQDVGNFAASEAQTYQNMTPGVIADSAVAKAQFKTLRENFNMKLKALDDAYSKGEFKDNGLPVIASQPTTTQPANQFPQVGQEFMGGTVKSIKLKGKAR